jgi:hypothetical protein
MFIHIVSKIQVAPSGALEFRGMPVFATDKALHPELGGGVIILVQIL